MTTTTVKTSNNLKHTITSMLSKTEKIKISIRLNDECNNGHCDFAITADITENGRWVAGGCCHDEILKANPELKVFVDLHLSDAQGIPMYAVENGFYHAQEGKVSVVMDYLRVTESEAKTLMNAEDKLRFAFLIKELGLVERWKAQANEAIAILEEWTGSKFKDVAKNGRGEVINNKQFKEVSEKVNAGYYSPENIAIRKDIATKEAYNKVLSDLKKDRDKEIEKANNEYNVKLAVLEAGLNIENFIYYSHSNEGAFNWNTSSWNKAITTKEFEAFLKKVNKKGLPKGIEFKIK